MAPRFAGWVSRTSARPPSFGRGSKAQTLPSAEEHEHHATIPDRAAADDQIQIAGTPAQRASQVADKNTGVTLSEVQALYPIEEHEHRLIAPDEAAIDDQIQIAGTPAQQANQVA